MLLRKNLFVWRHVVASSFLLLSEHKFGLHIIKNFSVRHKLHRLVLLL